jgi:hypothetical protein
LVEQSDKAGLGRMGWRFFSILEMYNISNVWYLISNITNIYSESRIYIYIYTISLCPTDIQIYTNIYIYSISILGCASLYLDVHPT